MADLKEIASALERGDAPAVGKMTQDALDEGVSPEQILDGALIAGMQVVGERFKNNDIYLPEVLIAARAMESGMRVLEPHLVKAGVKPTGTIAMGTIRGDLHDIGKNLVGMMLEGAGFEVLDEGVDLTVDKFITAAKDNSAEIIAASALLTTTMTGMKDLVEAVKASDIGDKVKVIIGGAPVTQAYCDEIGADGYAADAASAADLAKTFIGA